MLYRRDKVLYQFFNPTQPKIVVKQLWLKIQQLPEETQGVLWMKEKYEIYLPAAKCKIYPDWSALVCIPPKSNDYMKTKKNLFVSPHSNVPSHGSFHPCDHNLQFPTWLPATAQVLWIARVRHIPSSISLFIVLIFHGRFISFRKSSRKHWMPISCWPMCEGPVKTAGAGGCMEI